MKKDLNYLHSKAAGEEQALRERMCLMTERKLTIPI